MYTTFGPVSAYNYFNSVFESFGWKKNNFTVSMSIIILILNSQSRHYTVYDYRMVQYYAIRHGYWKCSHHGTLCVVRYSNENPIKTTSLNAL